MAENASVPSPAGQGTDSLEELRKQLEELRRAHEDLGNRYAGQTRSTNKALEEYRQAQETIKALERQGELTKQEAERARQEAERVLKQAQEKEADWTKRVQEAETKAAAAALRLKTLEENPDLLAFARLLPETADEEQMEAVVKELQAARQKDQDLARRQAQVTPPKPVSVGQGAQLTLEQAHALLSKAQTFAERAEIARRAGIPVA